MKLLASVLLSLSLPFAVLSFGFDPKGYHLEIDATNLTTSQTFNGSVNISLEVSTSPNIFVLDAVDLNVSSVKMILLPSNRDMPITSFNTNGTHLAIVFDRSLLKANYNLSIAFQGRYRSSMAGFAKVGYYYNGTLRYLGVTSFEPNYTRYVFPCADDPNPRVAITLDVITLNQTVLSSVQYDSIDIKDSKSTYRFTSYPKMAVYQLGWAVIEENTFEVLSDNSTQTPVYTMAMYPYKNFTSWATALTAGLLDSAQQYTGLSYPLTKLDQLVVPEFFVGAVQSWGLISYSEEAFLVDDQRGATSTRVKHQMALGVARQVLKQWFGDYVTMDTWENSWLMNGFVEHLKFSISDSVPKISKWELTKHEVVDLIQPALAMDSSPNKITPLSSLDKYRGGALIRMLQDIVGDDIFKTAVVEYLSKKQGSDKNQPTDFWDDLYTEAYYSDLNKKSITDIMNSWTEIPGYPVLNVTSNGTHFFIRQPRPGRVFPVTYLLERQSIANVPRVWLNESYDPIIPAGGSKWILLNLNQTGYYRVNYDQTVLRELIIDFGKLPTISRSQLVDDMFSLAMNGDGKMIQLMQFLLVLKNETDYYPWNSALRNFQNLIDKFYGHTSYEPLKSFMLDQMKTVIDNVGMIRRDQDSHTDILKRVMVLEKACAFGHEKCVQKAVSILGSWRAGNYFDADLNMGLLCSAVANSSDDTWGQLILMQKQAVVPTVRSAILKALTCTNNVQLLNEYLNNITSTTQSVLNPKDKNVFLQTLASTPNGANMLLNWLLGKLNSQIDVGTTTVGPASNSTNSSANVSLEGNYVSLSVSESLSEEDIKLILSLIRPKLTSSDQAEKLDKFAAAKTKSGLSNSTLELIEQTRFQVHNQYNWASNYSADIAKWVQDASATTPGAVTNPPTTATTMNTPPATGKPSSASALYSSLALTVVVVASQYLQIFS